MPRHADADGVWPLMSLRPISAFKRFRTEPRLVQWPGFSLVLLGTFFILCRSILAPLPQSTLSHVLGIVGASCVCVGLLFVCWAMSVTADSYVWACAILLTLGLMLFFIFEVWIGAAPDDLALTNEHRKGFVLAASGLAIVCLSLIGFVYKNIEDFKRPPIGPTNYLLYGVLCFGAGALVFLLVAIGETVLGRQSSGYHIHANASIFGAVLFFTGALFMWLMAARVRKNLDLIIVNNFPATRLVESSIAWAQVHRFISVSAVFLTLALICVCLFTTTPTTRTQLPPITTTVSLSLTPASTYTNTTTSTNTNTNINTSVSTSVTAPTRTYAPTPVVPTPVPTPVLTDVPPVVAAFVVEYVTMLAFGAISLLLGVAFIPLTISLYVTRKNFRYTLAPVGFTAITIGWVVLGVAALLFASDVDAAATTLSQPTHALWLAASLLQLCGSLFLVAQGVVLFHRELGFFSPANYLFLSACLWFGAAVASVCFVVGSGASAPVRLWALESLFFSVTLHFVGSVVYALHSQLCLDVSKVSNFRNNLYENKRFGESSYGQSPSSGSQEHGRHTVDVLICGCGPVGLTTANELGIRHVKTLVCDQRAAVVSDSRFFVTNGATCEGLQRLGVLERIINYGVPPNFELSSSYSCGFAHDDAELYARSRGYTRDESMSLQHDQDPLICSRCLTEPMCSQAPQRVMQSGQEQCLKENIEERFSRYVELRYGWKLTSFTQYDDCVDATLECVLPGREGEELLVRASYLVGCDGPSSIVAHDLNLHYDGLVNLATSRSTNITCPDLLDRVRAKLGENLQYHVAINDYGVGYFVPSRLDLGYWTFHLYGLVDGPRPFQVPSDQMHSVIQRFLGPDVEFEIRADGRWSWNFFFARNLRQHRVFVAGDAAHSHPPFGGLGGNTGYCDANNIGWKLAAVVKGWGGEHMLDSYETERRIGGLRVAMFVLSMTPRPGRLLQVAKYSKIKWLRWFINARWKYANSGVHHGNHYASGGVQLGIRYDNSEIIVQDDEKMFPPDDPPCEYIPKLFCGARAPHVRLDDGTALFDKVIMYGYTFVLNRRLVYGTESATMSLDTLREKFHEHNIPFSEVALDELARNSNGKNRKMFEMYERNYVVVIRPDLYVAWRFEIGEPQLSAFAADVVAQTLCGKRIREDKQEIAFRYQSFLTSRFLNDTAPWLKIFTNALFVENQEKQQVMAELRRRRQAQNVAIATKTETTNLEKTE